MQVVYEKLPFKKKKCVATIGAFDGVHLGHRFILRKVKDEARKKGISSLAISFDIHPSKLLSKSHPASTKVYTGNIINHRQKKALIKSEGLDYIWFLKTHRSFLKLSGKEFLEYILRYFDIAELIVGEDFHFGYKGQAGIEYLKKASRDYNFDLKIIRKIKKSGVTISSSLIRKLIKAAEFNKVKFFLGRSYCLEGKVIKGKGLGQRLGFPTANIRFFDYIIPQQGVYAACINISGKNYLCGINIGTRPTVSRYKKQSLEAYIINFNKNILGKVVRIYFLKRIRGEKKFPSHKQLSRAITNDIKYIKKHYRIPKNVL